MLFVFLNSHRECIGNIRSFHTSGYLELRLEYIAQLFKSEQTLH